MTIKNIDGGSASHIPAATELATAHFGEPVRVTDYNSTMKTVSFARKSEAQGYPVNWNISEQLNFTL